ncbi:hypothetical protein HDU99_003267, partial [Rhizoclosmatium hyalinum]
MAKTSESTRDDEPTKPLSTLNTVAAETSAPPVGTRRKTILTKPKKQEEPAD